MNTPISPEINTLFATNEFNDLKRFIESRQTLNTYTIRFRYLFHTLQCSSIFITTYAVGYSSTNNGNTTENSLVWLGIGLNILATLISAYEQVNRSISTKMFNDIQKIKKGTYVDESDYNDSKRIHSTPANSLNAD